MNVAVRWRPLSSPTQDRYEATRRPRRLEGVHIDRSARIPVEAVRSYVRRLRAS